MGLVKQVVSALTRRKIMQLTHTYITLSLQGEENRVEVTVFRAQLGSDELTAYCVVLSIPADISNTVGLEGRDDGEGHILRMVEAGEIRARIESPAGTVHFLEEAEVSSPGMMTSRLECDLQNTAELTERVRKLEARLMTNSVFVQKVRMEIKETRES